MAAFPAASVAPPPLPPPGMEPLGMFLDMRLIASFTLSAILMIYFRCVDLFWMCRNKIYLGDG